MPQINFDDLVNIMSVHQYLQLRPFTNIYTIYQYLQPTDTTINTIYQPTYTIISTTHQYLQFTDTIISTLYQYQ